MSLPIEELGGLAASEINLRILQSKVDMGEMLDEKLETVTRAIDTRMDGHEAAVNIRLDKQDASIAEILTIVTRSDKKGDEWHNGDLDWRSSIERRVSKIEELLKLLRLYVLATRAFKMAKASMSYAVKEGRQLGIWIAALTGAWLTTINFISTVWPKYLHPFLLLHHIMKH